MEETQMNFFLLRNHEPAVGKEIRGFKQCKTKRRIKLANINQLSFVQFLMKNYWL